MAAGGAVNASPALIAQLRAHGLEVEPSPGRLSDRGAQWMRHSALLEHFTPEQADILGQAMVLVRARPGQVLVREGEQSEWMLVLLAGTIDVTKKMPVPEADGSMHEVDTRLAVLPPGGVVGEMSMLDQAPRFATLTAIEAIEAGVITRMAIRRLIDEHPAVGAKLLVRVTEMIAQRLRNASNQLTRLLDERRLEVGEHRRAAR
jgi:CRP/FNR family transcriptional regulator, cyclic AMP receptor protein